MNASPAPVDESAPVSADEAAALFAGLGTEKSLLVAVSGGPDSVALLVLLAGWARAPGQPSLRAATVDHGLREGSAAEAGMVAALCGELDIPHETLLWTGRKPATGLQARARKARYALLAQAAARQGGAVVVTAHTLEDQAETMLMRMAHGSGPTGLAGMRARSERDGFRLARPLLGVPKARLVATLSQRDLPFASDPSNRDARFERVRWRALMPALAEAGLNAARLGLLSRRLARMEAALAVQTARLWPELLLADAGADGVDLRFSSLVDEPDEIALRIVMRALAVVAGDGLARLERLESCLSALLEAARGGVAMARTLSGCVLVLRRDGVLCVRREASRRRGVHPAAS